MAEIKLEDLSAATEAVMAIAGEMDGLTDPAELKAKTDRLQERAATLEQMAHAYTAQEKARHGYDPDQELPGSGWSDVELTTEQRMMVLEETGLDMEIIQLEGDSWPPLLEHMQPFQLNVIILDAARRLVAKREGEAAFKAELARLMENEDTRKAMLEAAAKDPDFMGGALKDMVPE